MASRLCCAVGPARLGNFPIVCWKAKRVTHFIYLLLTRPSHAAVLVVVFWSPPAEIDSSMDPFYLGNHVLSLVSKCHLGIYAIASIYYMLPCRQCLLDIQPMSKPLVELIAC